MRSGRVSNCVSFVQRVASNVLSAGPSASVGDRLSTAIACALGQQSACCCALIAHSLRALFAMWFLCVFRPPSVRRSAAQPARAAINCAPLLHKVRLPPFPCCVLSLRRLGRCGASRAPCFYLQLACVAFASQSFRSGLDFVHAHAVSSLLCRRCAVCRRAWRGSIAVRGSYESLLWDAVRGRCEVVQLTQSFPHLSRCSSASLLHYPQQSTHCQHAPHASVTC